MIKRLIDKMKESTDYRKKNSLSNHFRQKRMKAFEDFLCKYYRDIVNNGELVKILDVGGRYDYWNSIDFRYASFCDFTLANLEKVIVPDDVRNFRSIIADATKLEQFRENEFDIVFSNSTIEHVGRMPEWKAMARNIKRVGKHYFLQTPNKMFPIEPHFLVPFFQFLPLKVRARLIYNHQLGSTRQGGNWEESISTAAGINLLEYRDLRQLFPTAIIKRERFLLLTKSFMVCE